PAWTATTLGPAGPVAGGALQRTQEVENALLLAVRDPDEVLDARVRLRGVAAEEAAAAMRPDRLAQVRGAPVVQEEQPLSQSPQGSGAKLPPARLSLGDPVGQPRAHVVDQQVGEEIHRLIAQRGDGRVSRVERGRMAERAADGGEQLPAPRDRFDTPRRIERRRRRREEAREEGELLDRAQALDQRLGDALGGVVGDRRELAARGLVALGLKEL